MPTSGCTQWRASFRSAGARCRVWWTSYAGPVLRRIGGRRAALSGGALGLFLVALALSWTQGADHLTLQVLAMGFGLVACLLAAFAAGFGRRERPS